METVNCVTMTVYYHTTQLCCLIKWIALKEDSSLNHMSKHVKSSVRCLDLGKRKEAEILQTKELY